MIVFYALYKLHKAEAFNYVLQIRVLQLWMNLFQWRVFLNLKIALLYFNSQRKEMLKEDNIVSYALI